MWLRRNAQLSQEYNGLKWHHHQQQEQLQRLLQQSPAPQLVNSPAGVIVMPPPSPAQVDDFFGALAALGDTSEQPGATETSAAAEDSGVGTASPNRADNSSAGFPHGVASVGPASAPSLPPSSPSHEPFASHSPISNPASLAAACSSTPNSSYVLSTPPLFSTGQRAVIVGATSALDGTLAAPCDKEY